MIGAKPGLLRFFAVKAKPLPMENRTNRKPDPDLLGHSMRIKLGDACDSCDSHARYVLDFAL